MLNFNFHLKIVSKGRNYFLSVFEGSEFKFKILLSPIASQAVSEFLEGYIDGKGVSVAEPDSLSSLCEAT